MEHMHNHHGVFESPGQHRLYHTAFLFAGITIGYNILEGLVSVAFGFSDKSLSLFGFGVDSFIEVISAIGVLHMLVRIRRHRSDAKDTYERTALRITGSAFYGLTVGLICMSAYNGAAQRKPETTFWGVVISILSIAVMFVLMREKRRVGQELGSEAIIADAECSKVCLYMSLVLLASSALFELTGIGWMDSLGAFGLAYFSFREGRECFEKAEHDSICGCKKT